jgi:hypothetical protein
MGSTDAAMTTLFDVVIGSRETGKRKQVNKETRNEETVGGRWV